MELIRTPMGSTSRGPTLNNGLNGGNRSHNHRGEVHDQLLTSRAVSSACSNRYDEGQYQRGQYSIRYEDKGHPNYRRYSASEERTLTTEVSPFSNKHNEEHRDKEIDSPPLYTSYPMGPPPLPASYHAQNEDSHSFRSDNAKYRDEYHQRALESQLRAINQPSSRSESGFGAALDRPFRVLALPQIDYRDGSPFLRAYSHELQLYGVSEHVFFEALDAINVARVPNPENQVFQTGANIAKLFIPGGAKLGLMAGQLGVGLATRIGHSSLVDRVLLKINLEIFIPNTLEICICTAKEVNAEVGLSPNEPRRDFVSGLSPQDKVTTYGDLVASLTRVLPPAENIGRQDSIAGLGNFLNGRRTRKKVAKAERRDAWKRGENKRMSQLESSLQWLMVRRASPGTVEQWQMMLRQRNQDLNNGQVH
ncbi:hypothetical protein, variant 2 [Exophiala oligosperma]|uniref:Uncharacterized protein n=1 Tax=Exophiala oligosperma TaxID=215243 RepID=A0A0D2ECQ5_9EURO|nr:hypothetical protein, variant 2 [Exophiala oligosperma]KIW45764.1 hypothetical protein, variant 2 [Exophiala oligosperma]